MRRKGRGTCDDSGRDGGRQPVPSTGHKHRSSSSHQCSASVHYGRRVLKEFLHRLSATQSVVFVCVFWPHTHHPAAGMQRQSGRLKSSMTKDVQARQLE